MADDKQFVIASEALNEDGIPESPDFLASVELTEADFRALIDALDSAQEDLAEAIHWHEKHDYERDAVEAWKEAIDTYEVLRERLSGLL